MIKLNKNSEEEAIFAISHDFFPLARALSSALVRAPQQDMHTLTIDIVVPLLNESPRDESFISQRLSCVVLESKEARKRLVRFDQCECDNGCKNCSVKFWFDVVGTKEKPYVSTLDLKTDCSWVKVQEQEMYRRHMESKKSKEPFEGDTVLFALDEGKVASFRLLARLGGGRTHAKWTPVCAPGLWYKHKVILPDLEDLEKLKDVCPRGVFADSKTIKHDLCNSCNECVKWGKKNKKVIKIEEQQPIFLRYTTKQLSPKDTLFAAIDSLIWRVEKVLIERKIELKSDIEMED